MVKNGAIGIALSLLKPLNIETTIQLSKLNREAKNKVNAILIGPSIAPRTIPNWISPNPRPCLFVMNHMTPKMNKGIKDPIKIPHSAAVRKIFPRATLTDAKKIPIKMKIKGI